MSGAFVGSVLLVRLVSDRSGVSRGDTEKVLSAHAEVTLELLAQGAKVRALGGTGFLTTIKTKASHRLSPITGGFVEVPAKEKIVFRTSERTAKRSKNKKKK